MTHLTSIVTDKQRIAELEAEVAALKEQLRQLADPTQSNPEEDAFYDRAEQANFVRDLVSGDAK